MLLSLFHASTHETLLPVKSSLCAVLILLFFCCSKDMVIVGKDDALLNRYIAQYENGNWLKRREAVREIAAFQSEKAIDLLLTATEDVHQGVVIEALKHLSKILPEQGRERVRYMAEFEKNDNVRWYALKVLAQYRDPASAPVFVIGLNSQDWLIREESIRGLLLIDDYVVKYVSIPYIVEALNDRRINVRIAALENLDIKDERLYRTIVGMLPDSEWNTSLLAGILKALKGYRLDDKTRNYIVRLMTHRNTKIRLLAFRVLREERLIRSE